MFNSKIFSSHVSKMGPPEAGAVIHNLLHHMNSNIASTSPIGAPDCMKFLTTATFLAPLFDKFLQSMKFLPVVWLITFRLMDDEMFVMI